MSKLHELLAVENDLDNTAKKVLDEARATFGSKAQLFQGAVRVYKPFVEDENEDYGALAETRELTTTVSDKVDYVTGHLARLWDAVYQKELTNQSAIADIVVEGKIIASGVPATFLLGLEKRLANLRKVYEYVPTLQPGMKWVADADKGENIWRTAEPDKKYRTRKSFRHQVLVEPTEHHPAQIEKWEENENVGVFETTHWSGMLTSNDKSKLLHRIDTLQQAVKKARQRANATEVKKEKIADALFTYINGPL